MVFGTISWKNLSWENFVVGNIPDQISWENFVVGNIPDQICWEKLLLGLLVSFLKMSLWKNFVWEYWEKSFENIVLDKFIWETWECFTWENFVWENCEYFTWEIFPAHVC